MSLRADVAHALRQFSKRPGFALAVAATLALGIGANTAILSFVHAILLRPLPFAEPDRLVAIEEINIAGGRDFGTLATETAAEMIGAFRTVGEYDRMVRGGGWSRVPFEPVRFPPPGLPARRSWASPHRASPL